jgi:hypothetical protein
MFALPSSNTGEGNNAGHSMALGTDLEALRTRMAAAPDYEDDFTSGTEFDTHYRFGSYPATEDTPGIVIAEEIIPEQELVNDKNERQYNFGSHTIGQYMLANSFAVVAQTPELAAAVRGLGFAGGVIPTDNRGSRLVVGVYPPAAEFNDRLHQVGHNVVTLEQNMSASYPKHRERVEALAAGRLITTSSLDMLATVSVQGMISASTLRLLRDQAVYALDHQDEAEPDRLYSFNHVNHVSMSLQGLTAVNMPKYLTAALNDPYNGTVSPTPLEELGFHLKNITRYADLEAADHGLSLAEDTVRHIQALARIA